MWDMIDNVFDSVGESSKVLKLKAQKMVLHEEVQLQATQAAYEDEDVLAGVLEDTKKEISKMYNIRANEGVNRFTNLRVDTTTEGVK